MGGTVDLMDSGTRVRDGENNDKVRTHRGPKTHRGPHSL